MALGSSTRRKLLAGLAASPLAGAALAGPSAHGGSPRRLPRKVHGTVLPGYEGVRAAFADNLASGMEGGASFAVYREGVPVADLWGGSADEAGSVEVTDRSLFCLFSATKGLTSLCIAMLVDRGKLDYNAPVAAYWPEFAASGKAAITVGEMMSHQAGLVGTRAPATIEDYYAHDAIAAKLAAQEPFFRPGLWGYHAMTFGTLADELVRRTDGRTLGKFFAEEVGAKLGGDVFMGLPVAEDKRYAEMAGFPDSKTMLFDFPDPAASAAALMNPVIDVKWPNHRPFRQSGIPAAGASGNARGLAKLYASLVSDNQPGVSTLLSKAALHEATRERISGVDLCLGGFGRYAAGFRLNSGTMGSNNSSFGHPGLGGSVAFADPARKLGVAYTTNKPVNPHWQAIDPRLALLLRALYTAEAAQSASPNNG